MNVPTALTFVFIMFMTRPSIEIPETAVEFIISSIEIVNERTKDMYDSLANDDDITPDVIIAYLEQIPVIGTGVNMITGGKDDKVSAIQNQLNTFSDQLKLILLLTEDIKLKTDFLATNIIISTAASTITSCSKDRNTFLLDPQSQQAKNRVIRDACSHDIMDPIRQNVRILKEEQFTLDSPNLFKYMINPDGSCDGPNIENTYKYLSGLVLDGCRTAIITEEILYNRTSKIMLTECKQEASYVSVLYKSVFNRCIKYPCERVQTEIEHSIWKMFDKPVDQQRKILSTKFPWFKFFVAKFSADPEFTLIGNRPLSKMVFQKGDKHLIILWDSYAPTWSACEADFHPNQHFIAASFKSTVLEGASVGMDLKVYSKTNQGILRSCITEPADVTYNSCPAKIIGKTSGSSSHISYIDYWFLFCLVYKTLM